MRERAGIGERVCRRNGRRERRGVLDAQRAASSGVAKYWLGATPNARLNVAA